MLLPVPRDNENPSLEGSKMAGSILRPEKFSVLRIVDTASTRA